MTMNKGMTMTVQKIARVTADWTKMAGEPISITEIKGTIYASGSELACLRLAYTFRHSGDRAKMINNHNGFIFRLEPRFACNEA